MVTERWNLFNLYRFRHRKVRLNRIESDYLNCSKKGGVGFATRNLDTFELQIAHANTSNIPVFHLFLTLHKSICFLRISSYGQAQFATGWNRSIHSVLKQFILMPCWLSHIFIVWKLCMLHAAGKMLIISFLQCKSKQFSVKRRQILCCFSPLQLNTFDEAMHDLVA